MNVHATINAFRVARNPSLALPHYSIPTFDKLPFPLLEAQRLPGNAEGKSVSVRAVVLDKDNCFAAPKTNSIHPTNTATFNALVKAFTPSRVLIVSNSSGLRSKDPNYSKAAELESATGVQVLRHDEPKPALSCANAILHHFKEFVTERSQIVIVGDRLFTDVAMANAIGARSIWVREGVVPDRGFVTKFECWLYDTLLKRGFDRSIK